MSKKKGSAVLPPQPRAATDGSVAGTVSEFKILWVDNDPGAIASDKKKVTEYAVANHAEIELKIEESVSVDDALVKLRGSEYDLVVTDADLGRNEKPGENLVREMRNRSLWTDIVFYTRRPSFAQGAEENVNKAGFTFTVGDEGLAPAIMSKIKERLARFEKASFLRGMVITAFIDVETRLNDFFTEYYAGKNDKRNVRTTILENSGFDVGAKVKALMLIAFGNTKGRAEDPVRPPLNSLTRKQIKDGIELIRKSAEERNNLAHCRIAPKDKLELVSMGEPHTYGRPEITAILGTTRECCSFIDQLIGCLKPGS